MYPGVPASSFLAVITPPWNCWNTRPLSRTPALRSPVRGLPRACRWYSVADAYFAAIGPVSVTSTSLSPPVSFTSAGGGAAVSEVAINPIRGDDDGSTPLTLLQPPVTSATTARPTIAVWRYAIVFMGPTLASSFGVGQASAGIGVADLGAKSL